MGRRSGKANPYLGLSAGLIKENIRPFSFSCEPALYRRFLDMAKERNMNVSMLLRRYMTLQIRNWMKGEEEEEMYS